MILWYGLQKIIKRMEPEGFVWNTCVWNQLWNQPVCYGLHISAFQDGDDDDPLLLLIAG